MKKFAIVILNWNGKDLLEKYLPFLLKYTDTTIADIVIADNHSTDGSIEFLKTNYPNLSLIILPENYGFAEGYNKALAQVEAEYYVLLNSDVEVTENWLAPLTDFLDKNADTACVQPKILAERNKEYFEYAGACGGFIDKYGYPFCRGRIFATVENDEQQYNNPLQIFWATGACMVIRSKDFKDAGGFDGTFFAHMEEIDLCWRLNARGRKIYCIPQSVVYHVGGATLSKESPRKTFLNFRNNMLMLYKNLGYENFKRLFYTRISLDYLAASQ
ncbi:MAG TPA: glycosyl transferase family 2, partial [Dysgonomonas sp.]|nr:glycosyl transferase family 2 [Dysgonomonas sp.]